MKEKSYEITIEYTDGTSDKYENANLITHQSGNMVSVMLDGEDTRFLIPTFDVKKITAKSKHSSWGKA